MKFFKRGITMAISIITALSCLGGCSGGGKDSTESSGANQNYKNAYDVMNLGEIPVGMWVTLPDAYRTDANFADMRACGINFINGFEYFEPSLDEIKEALNLADNNDLKYLVNDKKVSELIVEYGQTKNPALVEQAMTRIEEYYQYPAYAGQLLKDEPSRSEFENLKPFIDSYTYNYPGKRWAVNMFPNYASGGTGVPYEQYVDDWLEMVKPDYYSYDSYPLLEYDENDYFARPETEDYYYNLDILRAKTLNEGIPFWSFIQTLGFVNPEGVSHREPSREDIRWQVFTNLAFGVKGLQYFCYYTPGSGRETFYSALVDQEGNKTVRYDYVKELNTDFNEFGKILLRCDAEGVILNGVKSTEKRYQLYEEAFTAYGSVESVSGGKFLAGCFKDTKDGKKYLLIVPTTPRDSANAILTFAKDQEVTVWKGNQKSQMSTSGKNLELKVEAGDAVFVEL